MGNNAKSKKEEALLYHSEGRPGKIEVIPTKPYSTQKDLSLAYSPGVAEPCLAIEDNPDDAYKYTAKGNLVAVISNGTAVLGLGDIGAMAGKPVMEGKGHEITNNLPQNEASFNLAKQSLMKSIRAPLTQGSLWGGTVPRPLHKGG